MSSWINIQMHKLHYADQTILVPVPSNGCLPMRDLRLFFPDATGLHYSVQNCLVSVSQSLPYHEGVLDHSRVVLHLPHSVPVFIVTSDNLLGSSHRDIKLNMNGKVVEFLDRINKKLKARRLLVDCAILVLEDLYTFEEMLDTEPAQVQQVFESFSHNGSRGCMKNIIHGEPVQTGVTKLSPKIQQVFDYFADKISEESELMQDKIKEEPTKGVVVQNFSCNTLPVPDNKFSGCRKLMEAKFEEEPAQPEDMSLPKMSPKVQHFFDSISHRMEDALNEEFVQQTQVSVRNLSPKNKEVLDHKLEVKINKEPTLTVDVLASRLSPKVQCFFDSISNELSENRELLKDTIIHEPNWSLGGSVPELSRPKVVKKIRMKKINLKKVRDDYGFSDPEDGENTPDISVHSEYANVSTNLTATSACVSSRPRLVHHRQGNLPHSNKEDVDKVSNKLNKDLHEKKKMVIVIDIE